MKTDGSDHISILLKRNIRSRRLYVLGKIMVFLIYYAISLNILFLKGFNFYIFII